MVSEWTSHRTTPIISSCYRSSGTFYFWYEKFNLSSYNLSMLYHLRQGWSNWDATPLSRWFSIPLGGKYCLLWSHSDDSLELSDIKIRYQTRKMKFYSNHIFDRVLRFLRGVHIKYHFDELNYSCGIVCYCYNLSRCILSILD